MENYNFCSELDSVVDSSRMEKKHKKTKKCLASSVYKGYGVSSEACIMENWVMGVMCCSLCPVTLAITNEEVYSLTWSLVILALVFITSIASAICIYWRFSYQYSQLNGNNGSWTNTDDVKGQNPCKFTNKCGLMSNHYHLKQPSKREAHPAQQRKERKIDLCKKISTLEVCKLDISVCNKIHDGAKIINVHWHDNNESCMSDAEVLKSGIKDAFTINDISHIYDLKFKGVGPTYSNLQGRKNDNNKKKIVYTAHSERVAEIMEKFLPKNNPSLFNECLFSLSEYFDDSLLALSEDESTYQRDLDRLDVELDKLTGFSIKKFHMEQFTSKYLLLPNFATYVYNQGIHTNDKEIDEKVKQELFSKINIIASGNDVGLTPLFVHPCFSKCGKNDREDAVSGIKHLVAYLYNFRLETQDLLAHVNYFLKKRGMKEILLYEEGSIYWSSTDSSDSSDTSDTSSTTSSSTSSNSTSASEKRARENLKGFGLGDTKTKKFKKKLEFGSIHWRPTVEELERSKRNLKRVTNGEGRYKGFVPTETELIRGSLALRKVGKKGETGPGKAEEPILPLPGEGDYGFIGPLRFVDTHSPSGPINNPKDPTDPTGFNGNGKEKLIPYPLRGNEKEIKQLVIISISTTSKEAIQTFITAAAEFFRSFTYSKRGNHSAYYIPYQNEIISVDNPVSLRKPYLNMFGRIMSYLYNIPGSLLDTGTFPEHKRYGRSVVKSLDKINLTNEVWNAQYETYIFQDLAQNLQARNFGYTPGSYSGDLYSWAITRIFNQISLFYGLQDYDYLTLDNVPTVIDTVMHVYNLMVSKMNRSALAIPIHSIADQVKKQN